VSEAIDGAAEIDLSSERGSCNAAHETHQMPPTTADWHDSWPIGGRHNRTDAVAAQDGKPGHGRSDAQGQIGFPPADGPEVEAAGPVDQDGDVEVAFLGRVPDMRFARPGQDRPIHAANVVARLVRASLPGLDTVADHE
jgi:hypothetical protein